MAEDKQTLIKKLELQIRILIIQIQILLLKKKLTVPNLDKPTKIIIHHGGGWLNFAGVNEWHRIKWGFKSSLGYYSGYTCFIERNGKVIQARRDNEEGAHTKGHNKRSIGIGLMGNGEEKAFEQAQIYALERLLFKKRGEYQIPRSEVYGHKDFAATLCPSDRLYEWLQEYKRSV